MVAQIELLFENLDCSILLFWLLIVNLSSGQTIVISIFAPKAHLAELYEVKLFKTTSVIQLHDKHFVPFISAEEIDFALSTMAAQVEADFADDVPIFIGVLNGAFMVVSDFLKHYKKPCEVSFIKMSSYDGMNSTNDVRQLIGLNIDVTNRSVVIIEDIVDTGNTIEELKALFKAQNVSHLKIATLFFKPDAYKKDIKLDYVGIRIPDKFIVGFGLDYDGLGRNLPEVYQLQ